MSDNNKTDSALIVKISEQVSQVLIRHKVY